MNEREKDGTDEKTRPASIASDLALSSDVPQLNYCRIRDHDLLRRIAGKATLHLVDPSSKSS